MDYILELRHRGADGVVFQVDRVPFTTDDDQAAEARRSAMDNPPFCTTRLHKVPLRCPLCGAETAYEPEGKCEFCPAPQDEETPLP